MKREFQVIYRTQAGGELHAIKVVADNADEARSALQDSHMTVTQVMEVGPVIDWTKPAFPKIEAAYYLGKTSDDYITRLQAKGVLPRGMTVFPRAILDAVLNGEEIPAENSRLRRVA